MHLYILNCICNTLDFVWMYLVPCIIVTLICVFKHESNCINITQQWNISINLKCIKPKKLVSTVVFMWRKFEWTDGYIRWHKYYSKTCIWIIVWLLNVFWSWVSGFANQENHYSDINIICMLLHTKFLGG